MLLSLFPERITVTIGLTPALQSLLQQLADQQVDYGPRIEAVTKRLVAATSGLEAAVNAHPDPDSTD